MFTQARIKLTAWYLVIIMTVSLFFSVIIYQTVSQEFQRRINAIERRMMAPGNVLFNPPSNDLVFINEIKEAQVKLLLTLLYTNGVIFFLSAVLGYLLAGKTLRPIEESITKQKRFISDASHELKTPITAILTSLEITLRDKNKTTKKLTTVIRENLKDMENLKKLTENMLFLAKNGEVPLIKTSFDTKEVILGELKLQKPIIKKRKIKIKKELSNQKINSSKEEFQKLFSILLDNAIKYSPDGKKISIQTKKKKGSFFLVVKDEGIGISKNDIKKIFERFYRSDISRTKTDSGGFGLGLSIAKQITDHLGGSIKVDSKLKIGSTFTVCLPFKS